MALRVLRCSIEEVADWHPRLFLEPHIVAAVAVLSGYSSSPARLEVDCQGIRSRWLRNAKRFILEISWNDSIADQAKRLRSTMQSRPLVEMASVALAMILTSQVISLGPLDVIKYGERADYRALNVPRVLEIGGTEMASELSRRHREKIAQALSNPFGWGAYVVVCAFSTQGHRIRFSGHPKETKHGKIKE